MKAAETFERAVSFCACLAWHFRELESVIGFRTAGGQVSLAPAADNIYDVLATAGRGATATAGAGPQFLE